METRAHVRGHPLHPLLVPLPIGLFVFGLIADIAYRVGAAPVWNDMAFYALVVGIIGALLAAVAGFLDYTALPRSRARELATVHMGLNLTVVVLEAVSVWTRTWSVPGAGLPFVLSLTAVVLLVVAGWIGGELVFRHGVGMDRGVDIRVEARRGAGRGAA